MKLLLTSGGITNQSIANALFELVGKKPEEINLAFIPTAMNADLSDKTWFIEDLQNIKKLNLQFVDIVDISALPKEIWMERFEKADVLFFCGGMTNHLMRWIKDSGLVDVLPQYLETKIWVGISAGSMVTGKTLALSNKDKALYYTEVYNRSESEGLGYVDFLMRPHLNSRFFPHANKEVIEEISKEFNVPIYALDDQSALKVVDGKVEVISEGEWVKFN